MRPPSFRASSVLLVMLSLSIGWGIRGNYGHEAGAMMPGALAAMAAALMSGREDWRRRVLYFAFFGALGWAFGGSISYMHPPSYTETGQLATQVYGFLSTFFEAFLWAGLGGQRLRMLPSRIAKNLLQSSVHCSGFLVYGRSNTLSRIHRFISRTACSRHSAVIVLNSGSAILFIGWTVNGWKPSLQ